MPDTDEAKLERVRKGLVMRLSDALQEHEAIIQWERYERGATLYHFVLKPRGESAMVVGLIARSMRQPTIELVRHIGNQFRDYLDTLNRIQDDA